MDEAEVVGPVTDAAGLGAAVLAQLVEHAADGIFLWDDERRWRYVNDSAATLLGQEPDALIGSDYVEVVPQRERAAARQHYAAWLDGSTEMLTRILTDATGEEREMVFAPVRIDIDGRRHGAAFFHDVSETRAATRAATALAHSAAESLERRSADSILSGAARFAVEGTRAHWAGLAVVGESGTFSSLGAYGPGGADFGPTSAASRSLQEAPAERFLTAMTAGTLRVGQVPGRAVTLDRRTWEGDPVLAGWGRTVLELDWESAVSVPLAYDDRVIGALMVLLPPGLTALSDPEIAFCTALADHTAVALANERLFRETARSAELRERARVARELHDSVSQAIFAMTMHARAAELSMAEAGLRADSPLGRSLEQLSLLSRGTLAEMRSLIFELRPEALTDAGLVTALRTQAAAVATRNQVVVTVDGPDARLPISPGVESALYLIVCTLVQDAVEHGQAHTVEILIRAEDGETVITVCDDGALNEPLGLGPDLGDQTTAATGRPGQIAATRDARFVGASVDVAVSDRTLVSLTLPSGHRAPTARATP